jgi:dihydroneopterin aldolase
MDIIYLRDLRVDAKIGVWEWERLVLQTLVIDLDFALDIGVASSTDDLKDTVDYKAISDRIMEFVSSSEFNLLEALGENLCKILMEEFELPWLWLKINKLGVLSGVKDVGIIIERGTRT